MSTGIQVKQKKQKLSSLAGKQHTLDLIYALMCVKNKNYLIIFYFYKLYLVLKSCGVIKGTFNVRACSALPVSSSTSLTITTNVFFDTELPSDSPRSYS